MPTRVALILAFALVLALPMPAQAAHFVENGELPSAQFSKEEATESFEQFIREHPPSLRVAPSSANSDSSKSVAISNSSGGILQALMGISQLAAFVTCMWLLLFALRWLMGRMRS